MEEMKLADPVRMSDVENVQLCIVKTVHLLEENG